MDILELKKSLQSERDKLFKKKAFLNNGFNFCVSLSLLIEEYIIKILNGKKFKFSILASGGFSRRELSPYSDIDVMFLLPEGDDDYSSEINQIITNLWDCGIEISHTVRKMSDAKKFLDEDLHSFTQFFETRFLFGSKKLYNDWNKNLFNLLDESKKINLMQEYFEDFRKRHLKYGDSPKVLEPNIKFTAGGLRDLQSVEWMYSIKNNINLSEDQELTQTELFLKRIKSEKIISEREYRRIKKSYEWLLRTRNLLHYVSGRRNDRLEFQNQEKIAELLDYDKDNWKEFMSHYFDASSLVHRFSKTMMKKFQEEITKPVSDYLTIELDEDFQLKGGKIITQRKRLLSLSSMMRAFYYRGLHAARFDRDLRSLITESVIALEEKEEQENYPTVFFREILNLPANVGDTLAAMNELGVLGIFMPEFRELIGFYQPGVYHCYTADEHTLIALKNLEELAERSDRMGTIYKGINRRDLLFISVLLHDIAKPISVSGHEIIGAEMANTICTRLGYSNKEKELVQFLVQHHLTMEQVAFRRNLNDPTTLNNFASIFPSHRALNMLYLLTYADLSAVSPAIWTQWKSDLLYELYSKTSTILKNKIDAESLLSKSIEETANGVKSLGETVIKEHIKAIDDLSYFNFFSEEEIKEHAEIIERKETYSVIFKSEKNFTVITVITNDSPSLLSRLCGALSISDLDIHDAKIFTRNDGIVIDTFNVTEFRTHKVVNPEKFNDIKDAIGRAITRQLQIIKEFKEVRSRWRLLENKLFKRNTKVKVKFEEHNRFTIIDIFSPDRLGLLYTVTKTLNELDLNIVFAKISTQGDNVVDSFYLLTREGKKVDKENYELVRVTITNAIEEIL